MVSNTLQEHSASTETSWGLPWEDVFAALRPSPDEINLYKSIISQVEDVLKDAHLPHNLFPGGSFGKKTLTTGENKLQLFSIYDDFQPDNYFEVHLKPMMAALKSANVFSDLKENGLAAVFNKDGIEVRILAAGVLYGGPKDLLLPLKENEKQSGEVLPDILRGQQIAREVHVETTCGVLRSQVIANQCPLYHDMVRSAKKWRSTCDFISSADMPGDYLIELLMLEAFTGAPCMPRGPGLYSTTMRRFLSLAAAQCGSGSDVMADDSMPKSMLWWDRYYNRGTIDLCMAKGLLDVGRSDLCSIIVVDPAVPFVNVARSVPDWSEMRKCARDSLSSFQNTDLLDSLDHRLRALSEGMLDTVNGMRNQIEALQLLVNSPRRWSGAIQFNEVHMNSDAWTKVMEVELQTVKWRINARKARTEGTGYTSCVDISLQRIGKKLERTIDVDVLFRGGTSNLVFDADVDHVLICRRSEIVRNRDYSIQVTIVG
ncbi:hypothetical protein BWQ96_03798 [Gracilariopsis chorda]|uniref:Uncharacterized protein n=1 Tax=Gracilariopsis chorda TaxID=448386 RepID=A0A2V3IW81_9FLOR|nr:hypothetical protein BWQ96_03798 [Gracilariopsis chorda]|eukprot:PXF46404.1 hypothetical protein BWQ96_03798 [Gracilariopsis chorda]